MTKVPRDAEVVNKVRARVPPGLQRHLRPLPRGGQAQAPRDREHEGKPRGELKLKLFKNYILIFTDGILASPNCHCGEQKRL